MAEDRLKRRLPTGSVLWLAGLVCLAALSSCTGEQSDDDAVAGIGETEDMKLAGRTKSMPCVACHGAEGISDYDVWPDLAGQTTEYLAKQLRDFRDGRRHDPWMSPMAVALEDQDIDDLAAYFSSIAGLSGGADSVPPQAIACVACHSARAGQANPLSPSLAGQNQRYTAKQLRDFRDGGRTDPVMAPFVIALSDRDIEAIAAFYASP